MIIYINLNIIETINFLFKHDIHTIDLKRKNVLRKFCHVIRSIHIQSIRFEKIFIFGEFEEIFSIFNFNYNYIV